MISMIVFSFRESQRGVTALCNRILHHTKAHIARARGHVKLPGSQELKASSTLLKSTAKYM